MTSSYHSNSAVAWGLAHTTPYGSQLLAFFWSLLVLATALVCARFYARRLTRNVGWDDWLALGALILDVACTGVQTKLVETLYLNTSRSVDRNLALVLWYSAQLAQVLAGCMGRASVAVFLLRIIGLRRSEKYLIAFCLTSTLISGLLFLGTTVAQCDFTQYFRHDQSRCLDPSGWEITAMVIFGWSIAIDLCLAAIPTIVLLALHVYKNGKFGLCLLIVAGWIVPIAAAVKTWQFSSIVLDWGQGKSLSSAASSLFTFSEGTPSPQSSSPRRTSQANVASVELLLIIVFACIPTLRPIYDRHFGRSSRQARKPSLLSSGPSMPPFRDFEHEKLKLIENADLASPSPPTTPVRTARVEL